MRIVKKTLKGDLMGNTGFKSVPSRRRNGMAGPDASGQEGQARNESDAAQRVLANVRDDDVTVITEPVPMRHGKAIVLNQDHQEVPPTTARAGNPAGAPPLPPGAQPAHGHGPPTEPAGAPTVKRRARIERAPQTAPAPVGSKAAGPNASPVGTGTPPRNGIAPSAPTTGAAPVAAAAPVRHVIQQPTLVLDGGSVSLARSVLAEALFRDMGLQGTRVNEPKGSHFVVHPKLGAGLVRTIHNLVLPLPEGHATNHAADLVIELENGAILVLDIVSSTVTSNEMKALSFDALQLRRLDLAFSVLVFIRTTSGLPQDQAQAIGHGYDFHFGVPEDHLHSEQAFTALRSRITQWVKAASTK